jgi:hypothetical protein
MKAPVDTLYTCVRIRLRCGAFWKPAKKNKGHDEYNMPRFPVQGTDIGYKALPLPISKTPNS